MSRYPSPHAARLRRQLIAAGKLTRWPVCTECARERDPKGFNFALAMCGPCVVALAARMAALEAELARLDRETPNAWKGATYYLVRALEHDSYELFCKLHPTEPRATCEGCGASLATPRDTYCSIGCGDRHSSGFASEGHTARAEAARDRDRELTAEVLPDHGDGLPF